MLMNAKPERILLGVGGGIAAYKSAELVRRLRDRGAQVRVVLTENAARFVTPVTFQALSGEPVRTSLWDEAAEAAMGHIELARWAERIVIAPATADLLARLAHGHADDLLTTLCITSEAPLFVAPAMNRVMWINAAVQANVAALVTRGVTVLGPSDGDQACGETGAGRMWEAADIADTVLEPTPDPSTLAALRGKRLLVSAGPTYEDLDPVRYLGNRSSGRMGYAIATQAQRFGMDVILVSGPVALSAPAGVTHIAVRSAEQMRAAVMAQLSDTDIFIASAAVADFRPREPRDSKIKKSHDGGLTLELVQNRDIVAEVAASTPRPFVVGFAAETDDVERYARDKLERKGLDMIAANRVGQEGCGFDADNNALSVLWPGGKAEIGLANKAQVARELLALIAARLEAVRV